MATKVNGAEFKRFYADPGFWPDDRGKTYHEDEVVEVDGEMVGDDFELEDVADTSVLKLEGGVVYSPKFKPDEEVSFETYFKRWRKLQTTTSLVVECDISKVDAVKAAIRAAGGKVQ